MHIPLLLLSLALGVVANQPTSPNPPNPSVSTFVDGNGTTRAVEVPNWAGEASYGNIVPRFKSGGFLDKCKDVRYYLSKADDMDPQNHGQNKGYKSSPWLVAKCPDKNGNYLCTWLELGKCLLNMDGELYRGPNGNFHESCTQCWLRDNGRLFGCRCWDEMSNDRLRLTKTTIDLNVAVANNNGYLYCHGNWGVLDYCTGRPSDDPSDKAWTCWVGLETLCKEKS